MNKLLLLLTLLFSFSGNTVAEGIKLMSWNVYFDDASGQQRYPAIIQTIAEQKPELVCLQEVTNQFIEQLTASKALSGYTFINTNGPGRYINLILSKTTIASSGTISLPTNMARTAPYIRTSINGQNSIIVNLHLDSMIDDTQLRLRQLEKVHEFTSKEQTVILCGDLNFGDDDEENSFIQKHFKDVGADNPKVTYDIENNALANKTRFPFEDSRRLDHILISKNIKARDYRVLSLPYSDHYPITAELLP